MLARHIVGLSSQAIKINPVVVRYLATETKPQEKRSWRDFFRGKKPEEEKPEAKKEAKKETKKETKIKTDETTTQPETQTTTPAPAPIAPRPPAPYTPYNIGNNLYPFFQEAEKYPGIKPAPLPKSKFDFPVIDFYTKQQTSSISLNRDVFNAPLRTDILHRVVVFQLDGKRQGTHSTKTRAEVRGGGKKPWNQKGTGRARIGSIRAPHWRGGGVTFGPKPRDHSTELPLKLRALGLKVALSTKLAQGKLVVVDNLTLDTHKTSQFNSHLPKEWGKVLIVNGEDNKNFLLASGNIPTVHTLNHVELNVYDILRHDTLVMTKGEVEGIEERMQYETLGKNGRELLQTQESVKISKEVNAKAHARAVIRKAERVAHKEAKEKKTQEIAA